MDSTGNTNMEEDVFAREIHQKANEHFKGKTRVDKIVKYIFLLLAIISIGIVILTLVYLLYSGLQPFFTQYQYGVDENGNALFAKLDFVKFISGLSYGAPIYAIGWLIVNTIYVTLLSMVLAIPLAVLTALFITRVAPKWLGKILNTIVDVLSGIPSVIIGVFGMGWVTKFVDIFSHSFGDAAWNSSGRSILTAMIILTLMCLPTICSMSVTAIKAVDRKITMASLALGATKTQTNFKVILPAAQSGIFAGIILGVGRAIGEATAIQMVTGSSGGINFGLFQNTATLTTQMLSGFGELSRTSLDYHTRFTIGLMLMVLIIFFNLLLNGIRKKIYNKNNGVVKQKKKKDPKMILTSSLLPVK